MMDWHPNNQPTQNIPPPLQQAGSDLWMESVEERHNSNFCFWNRSDSAGGVLLYYCCWLSVIHYSRIWYTLLCLTAESLWSKSVGTASGWRTTFSPLRSKQSSVKWVEQTDDRSRGCQLERPTAFNHWASWASLSRGNLKVRMVEYIIPEGSIQIK